MADTSNGAYPYPRLEPATAEAFNAWRAIAAPGSRVIYWHGCLARDTFDDPAVGLADAERRAALADLAYALRIAARHRAVRLFQKRASPETFFYIAELPPSAPAAEAAARLPAGAMEGSSAGRPNNGRTM